MFYSKFLEKRMPLIDPDYPFLLETMAIVYMDPKYDEKNLKMAKKFMASYSYAEKQIISLYIYN